MVLPCHMKCVLLEGVSDHFIRSTLNLTLQIPVKKFHLFIVSPASISIQFKLHVCLGRANVAQEFGPLLNPGMIVRGD